MKGWAHLIVTYLDRVGNGCEPTVSSSFRNRTQVIINPAEIWILFCTELGQNDAEWVGVRWVECDGVGLEGVGWDGVEVGWDEVGWD